MAVEDIRKLIRNLSNVRVMIIGDIMLDEYMWGKVSRISPEAPVPVVEIVKENAVLGGSANVANNVSSLGGKVISVGLIGNDLGGQKVKMMFEENGLPTCGLIIDDTRPTTVKTRVIAQQQQIVRTDKEKRHWVYGDTENNLLTFVRENIKDVDVVVLSDYAKGILSENVAQSIIQIANEFEKITIVDPKGSDYDKYIGAGVITPNLKEVQEATGVIVFDNETVLKAGKALMEKVKCRKAAIVTRGEEGMSIFQENGQVIHVTATSSSEVFDVTGAGDTVVATLALALGSGFSFEEAAIISNFAAGVVVRKLGTATATVKEILKDLKYREVEITKENWL